MGGIVGVGPLAPDAAVELGDGDSLIPLHAGTSGPLAIAVLSILRRGEHVGDLEVSWSEAARDGLGRVATGTMMALANAREEALSSHGEAWRVAFDAGGRPRDGGGPVARLLHVEAVYVGTGSRGARLGLRAIGAAVAAIDALPKATPGRTLVTLCACSSRQEPEAGLARYYRGGGFERVDVTAAVIDRFLDPPVEARNPPLRAADGTWMARDA